MRYFFVCMALVAILNSAIAFGNDEADELARIKQQNELLQAKLDEANLKIEKLEMQLADLKSRDKSEQWDEAEDLFSIGATWHGSRFYTQPGADPKKAQEWKMVVTDRDAKKFKGEIHFQSIDGLNQILMVSGSAPAANTGKVTFKTEQKGILQQTFTGVLKGGQISLQFQGTGVTGGKVTGTGNLKQ